MVRDLLYVYWLKAEKQASLTLKLVEDLSVAQVETTGMGGAQIVSASVNGRSFQYQLPKEQTHVQFLANLRDAYKALTTGGTGGMMTDEELKAFILDTSRQETNVARAVFSGGRAVGWP